MGTLFIRPVSDWWKRCLLPARRVKATTGEITKNVYQAEPGGHREWAWAQCRKLAACLLPDVLGFWIQVGALQFATNNIHCMATTHRDLRDNRS